MSEQNFRSPAMRGAPLAKRMRKLEQRAGELHNQLSQLEGAAQLRSQQFSDTVHELRSPLLAVAGYARLLLKESAGGINSTQREYLGVVLDNARKMTEVLKRAASSLAVLDLELRVFDVRELWQETAELIRAHTDRHLERLDVHFPPGPCLVFADREKLALVFHRLLSDVVRFSGPGGCVDLELTQRGRQTTARIKAAGADGLPEDSRTAPAVEGRPMQFSQAASETICIHGGKVSAEAAPDNGWCVSVTLPLIGPVAHQEVVEGNEQARRFGNR